MSRGKIKIKFWQKPHNHTPGEWVYDYSFGNHEVRNAEYFVAMAFNNINELDNKTAEANARLIAAAPDLLDACVEMLDNLRADYAEHDEEVRQYGSRWQFAIDALAKAYGVDDPGKDFADDEVDDVTKISREAFVETIVDLATLGITDLDALTADQMQTVFELFATHAIEARLFNDIGTKAITLPRDAHTASRVQAQLRDFIARGVSDALTAAKMVLSALTPDRVLGFVGSVYEEAFRMLEIMGEVEAGI